SNVRLNSVLNEFDNSDDFAESGEALPPNSDLDIACFEFLARESNAARISRDEILTFYEFGYFLPDPRIDEIIQRARTSSDVALLERLTTLPATLAEFR